MIIHISHAFFGYGAVSTRARQEVKSLVDMGYEVAVMTTTMRGRSFDPAFKKVRFHILPPQSLHARIMEPARRLTFALKVRNVLIKNYAKKQIEWIIYHPATLSWIVEPFCKRHGISSMYIAHSLIEDQISKSISPYTRLESLFYIPFEKMAIQKSTCCVAISVYMERLIAKNRPFDKKIAFLPNHVNTNYFLPPRTREKNIDLLFIGRFAKEKGIDILIDALGLLDKRYRPVLLGQGPLHDRLVKKAQQLHLNTIFLGHVPRSKVRRFLSNSRFLVLPSWAEPQGLVILEALACGTPVIGSDSGAIPEMIVPGCNGWLFKPGDHVSLAQTIEYAMQNENPEKLARNARESVLRWDLQHFGKKLNNILSNNPVHKRDAISIED
jgi:glycosyltransferase involved in cell wall biosynthesis